MKQDTQKTILLVAPFFPPHIGGLERYVDEIAKSLHATHHWRVVVLTSGEKGGMDIIEKTKEGVIVYRLGYSFKISNTPFSLLWFKKVKAVIKKEQPDIINIHTPVPGIGDIASFFAKDIPTIVTYHAESMKKNRFFLDILIRVYECCVMGFMLRRANQIVCSSDTIRLNFLNKYKNKSITISPAVDIHEFTPDFSKENIFQNVLFVASLGKSDTHKGLSTLLSAFSVIQKKLPETRLTIVGDGDMKGEYIKQVHRMGMSDVITFTGRLYGKELTQVYQRATVLVLPTSNDSYSMVTIEAMASGLPVVSTRVGAIPTLIDDGKTGYLIAPNDSDAVAEKVVEILSNKKLCDAMGRAGREKVLTGFSWGERAEAYDKIFTTIASSKDMNEKKSLTIVTPYFYPKIGGVENYAYNLAQRFLLSGEYRVNVITTSTAPNTYSEEIFQGLKIYKLPYWFKISNTPINPLWYFSMKKIFKKEQTSLINAHSPVPFFADMASLAGGKIPFVLTYHSGSMKKGRWMIDLIISFYEEIILRKLFSSVDVIVPVSQVFFETKLGEKYKNKAELIRPGVDTEVFYVTSLPVEPIKIITYVGRIEHSSSWKGIDQLLLAMCEVVKNAPETRLELIGGGDAVDYFKEEAKKMGIADHVVMCGPQSGKNLIEAYQRSSVIVLPSTSDAEQSSIVLIEAMASGRPVIGTRVGGTPQIIQNEKNGLLVPPKNPHALAEAIIRVLTDRTLTDTLVLGGNISVKEVDWQAQTKKYQIIFEKFK